MSAATKLSNKKTLDVVDYRFVYSVRNCAKVYVIRIAYNLLFDHPILARYV